LSVTVSSPLSAKRALPLKAGVHTNEALNFVTVRFPNWSVTAWSGIGTAGTGRRLRPRGVPPWAEKIIDAVLGAWA